MFRGFVVRFNGKHVVLECLDTGRHLELGRSAFPDTIRLGDVVIRHHSSEPYRIDHQLTKERKMDLQWLNETSCN